MGLSIKNDEVEAMIREVAAARKVSMTEAIRLAMLPEVERVRADRAAEVERRRRILLDMVERLRALPVLDDRTADEILGYDENGLPT